MYDLARMTLKDMTECSAALRRTGAGAGSMEEVAGHIVRLLYDTIGTADGRRACALVRLYKSHRYGDLPPDLQKFAQGVLGGGEHEADVKCLTLLATVGDEAAWNDRTKSSGHRAIPLPSPQVVEQLPMIAQLVKQFGIEVSALVQSESGLMVDNAQETFNVFHVPNAQGSPHIPAQDGFVIPYHIASVLGFGGLLPTGELFALILFARVPITHEVAELFKPMALSAKLALLPFAEGPIFS